jgi:di/tricarboxylate transporter
LSVVATGSLRPGNLLRAIRLDVILLQGALPRLRVALGTTGLAATLAGGPMQGITGWPVYAAPLLLFLFSPLIIEEIGAATAVAWLIPVADQLAVELGLPAHALFYAVLMGASQSSLSPIDTDFWRSPAMPPSRSP